MNTKKINLFILDGAGWVDKAKRAGQPTVPQAKSKSLNQRIPAKITTFIAILIHETSRFFIMGKA